MSTEPDLSVDFAGLQLANPVFTASGTCGYADELARFMDINALGGFITKSITLRPKGGCAVPRVVETDSGMLNAIGLANIGIERFIKEKLPIIQRLSIAVFVNVAGETIKEYVAVGERLAELKGIAGLELNVSCPNVERGGIAFGKDPHLLEQLTKQVKKAAPGKVIMVKLTPAVTDIAVMARAAVQGGADALSLINTFMAMVVDIEKRRPVLANRTGGLSGPAIKPMAVYLVNRVYEQVARESKVPILGMGGIKTGSDAVEFIVAGATAVAVGTETFIEPDCALKVINDIRRYCVRHNVHRVQELVGCLQ
jgi:dihydroorotate dehydrogenase (NAD+) catalytic subunit